MDLVASQLYHGAQQRKFERSQHSSRTVEGRQDGGGHKENRNSNKYSCANVENGATL